MKQNKKIFVAAVVLASLLFVYLAFAIYFQSHFCFGTTVNYVNVSGNSAKRVEEKIAEHLETYELTVIERGEAEEQIDAKSVGLQPDFGSEIQKLQKAQNGFAWPYYLITGQELTTDTALSLDEEKLSEVLRELACMDESRWTVSKDASISDYRDGGYEIVPEIYGTEIDEKKLSKQVQEAIVNLVPELDLSETGCYKDPKLTEDASELKAVCEKLNSYVNVVITYDVGDEKETLDGEMIHNWLSVDEDGQMVIDEEQIADYVLELARTYNTSYRNRTLDTSYGQTVSIIGGDYGWQIDREGEAAMILADLEAGEDVEREFVYAQTANSHGEHDYGSTYVEINLTAQHLFFYKNGALVIETDFVSGSLAQNHNTPVGAYSVTYKQRDATLRGQDYESEVSYWMPYCNDVGMHDASWRSSFGGSIYKRSGSHGCVNLPVSAAKTIYENIEAGYPVLVYELAGTESAVGIAQDAAYEVDNVIGAIGEVTLESQSAIENARAAYDALTELAKSYVKKLDVLTAAEAAYAQLKTDVENQAAATQAQQEAQPVIELIEAIEAAVSDENQIQEARKAYDALSDMAKAYVTNYTKLQSAEEQLELRGES